MGRVKFMHSRTVRNAKGRKGNDLPEHGRDQSRKQLLDLVGVKGITVASPELPSSRDFVPQLRHVHALFHQGFKPKALHSSPRG